MDKEDVVHIYNEILAIKRNEIGNSLFLLCSLQWLEVPSRRQEGRGKDEVNIGKVPPEAISFLSAVGVFLVLLVVLFLFINKKLCFETTGGLPCLDQQGKRKNSKDKTGIHEGLGKHHASQSPELGILLWFGSGKECHCYFRMDPIKKSHMSCLAAAVVDMMNGLY